MTDSARLDLASAARLIVVKVGTRVLTGPDGLLDTARIEALGRQFDANREATMSGQVLSALTGVPAQAYAALRDTDAGQRSDGQSFLQALQSGYSQGAGDIKGQLGSASGDLFRAQGTLAGQDSSILSQLASSNYSPTEGLQEIKSMRSQYDPSAGFAALQPMIDRDYRPDYSALTPLMDGGRDQKYLDAIMSSNYDPSAAFAQVNQNTKSGLGTLGGALGGLNDGGGQAVVKMI